LYLFLEPKPRPSLVFIQKIARFQQEAFATIEKKNNDKGMYNKQKSKTRKTWYYT